MGRTEHEHAKKLATSAASALGELPVPRRSQVQLALAWAYLTIGNHQSALITARSVLQLAGSRGFRLVSLEARAIMAHLTSGDDQETHRSVGQELARDFSRTLPPEMVRAFSRRPFLNFEKTMISKICRRDIESLDQKLPHGR